MLIVKLSIFEIFVNYNIDIWLLLFKIELDIILGVFV